MPNYVLGYDHPLPPERPRHLFPPPETPPKRWVYKTHSFSASDNGTAEDMLVAFILETRITLPDGSVQLARPKNFSKTDDVLQLPIPWKRLKQPPADPCI